MININDKLRIKKIDSRNLAVEIYVEIRNKKNEIRHEWKIYGFYGTLNQALRGSFNAALDCDVFDEKIQELKDVVDKLDAAHEEFKKAIDKLNKGCLNVYIV